MRQYWGRLGSASSSPSLAFPPLNGRYRVVRPLGAGASSRVFLVEDLHQARALRALKALAPSGDAALLRSEFAELSRLHHPNLAAVYEIDRVTAAGGDPAWGLERGTSFLTADFVDGVPADRAGDALPDAALREAFAVALATGAARALAFDSNEIWQSGPCRDKNSLKSIFKKLIHC